MPIGTIRYVPKTNKLSRLAILGDWRKFGFGRVLVKELERAAALAGREGKAEVKDGKVLIKCHSQVSTEILFGLGVEEGGSSGGGRKCRDLDWYRADDRYM